MHQHHGSVRLLVILVCLVLAGIAAYAVLMYGFARHTPASTVATSTGTYFPVTTSTSSPATTATSSVSGTLPSETASSSSWEQGMTIVTNADNNTTIYLAKNERFVIQLGSSMNWMLTFDPATGITRVPNSTTADGIQGVYEADQAGTTTLHASGAPICKAHQACPMYLAVMNVTFVVK